MNTMTIIKRISILILIFFSVSNLNAQIKLHDTGEISIGDLSSSGYGLQMSPTGYFRLKTRNNNAYSWANLSCVNSSTQKHWIVASNSTYNHLFYVFGNGNVWSNGYYVTQPQSQKGKNGVVSIGGAKALEILDGLNGYYYPGDDQVDASELENNECVSENAVEGILKDNGKRKAGLSAEELEAAFPESVRTDPEARFGIDYASVIAVLVEAVNEQQAEIERLRRVLEKNGLLKR